MLGIVEVYLWLVLAKTTETILETAKLCQSVNQSVSADAFLIVNIQLNFKRKRNTLWNQRVEKGKQTWKSNENWKINSGREFNECINDNNY